MLTLKALSDFSRGLQKARRWGLNLAKIRELYVSFQSSSDVEGTIWIELGPFEGWGTSEQSNRNNIITWKVHSFVKMLYYLINYLTFLLFSRTMK